MDFMRLMREDIKMDGFYFSDWDKMMMVYDSVWRVLEVGFLV